MDADEALNRVRKLPENLDGSVCRQVWEVAKVLAARVEELESEVRMVRGFDASGTKLLDVSIKDGTKKVSTIHELNERITKFEEMIVRFRLALMGVGVPTHVIEAVESGEPD